MKKISFLILFFLALTAMFSCSTKSENAPANGENIPVSPDAPEFSEPLTSDAPAVSENDDSTFETENNETIDTPAAPEETLKEPEPLPEVIFDERDSVFVMQIGGIDVSYSAFSYYFSKARQSYPENDSVLWEETALLEIKKDVATELLASLLSVEMDEEYKNKHVNDVIANTIKSHDGKENVSYPEALGFFNMSDMFFRQLQENTALTALIYNKRFSPESGTGYASDQKILSYIHENYAHIKQILISTVDLDNESKLQAKHKAEEILELIKNGENFEELITKYSDDPTDVTDGFYVSDGTTVHEISEKSFEMPQGSISDIVESPYGYHIIKKYPIDDEYVLSNNSLRDTAEKALCEDAFNNALYETANSLEVVFYDFYGQAIYELISKS